MKFVLQRIDECTGHLRKMAVQSTVPGDEQVSHRVVASAELLPGEVGRELQRGDNTVHLSQGQGLQDCSVIGQ